MKIGCISFFDSQLLNKIYGVYDLINIKLRISVCLSSLVSVQESFFEWFRESWLCASWNCMCICSSEVYRDMKKCDFIDDENQTSNTEE